MERDEIKRIVDEVFDEKRVMRADDVTDVVREAVHETLLTLGVDAAQPLDVQQDMHFVRELRAASEKIQSRGLLVLVGILVTGLAGAVWIGIKSSLGH
jgi:hypothetical protein